MSRTLWFMHALGENGLPSTAEVRGTRYHLETAVKHDFWAATGFYREAGGGGRIVIKINRRVSMRFIGRWLVRREMRAYAKLDDLPNIPALLGPVTDTGFAHVYVEGAPLVKKSIVSDTFFDELLALVTELNRRGVAYVDTNKPENIILGSDGRPHLIDFQIHVDANHLWPGVMARWALRVFHNADVYHVLKHKRRIRPDQLTDAERIRVERGGVMIRIHRVLTAPYFWVRRPVMRWLNRTGRVADTGSN
jgi:hypothetical protein